MPTLVTRGAMSARGWGFGGGTKVGPGLWSWGNNNYGQLGLNNITNYSSPKQVGLLTTWSVVACGTYHTVSIKTAGTLWSWGYNIFGQLGLNNRTNYSSPKQVGLLTTWSVVACGVYHTVSTHP